MFDDEVLAAARELLRACEAKDLQLAVVESCTGGLISAALTAIPGSSATFDRGFVTYTNEAKTELVNVPAADITLHGAVSSIVAERMARGGLENSNADACVSVTGVAGPSGGSAAKPVGYVYIGVSHTLAKHTATSSRLENFGDLGRDEIRRRTVISALNFCVETVSHGNAPA
ncbi:MAG: CinA family protein [Pseudomonadota bacterium]